MRASRVVLVVCTLVTLLGCHPGVTTGNRAQPIPGFGVLTASDVLPFQDAHRAILILRRHWLEGRAIARPSVFVDGVPTSGIEVLSGLPANRIVEIRFMPAHEASIRFGLGQIHGAIMVTTKR